jgi:hypothetical protein
MTWDEVEARLLSCSGDSPTNLPDISGEAVARASARGALCLGEVDLATAEVDFIYGFSLEPVAQTESSLATLHLDHSHERF